MSQLLESRWSETKGALLEGLDGNKKSVMATTLENTRKYLAESATTGATSSGNVATLNRVILPVIRRVMPTVIANELVGVQPMTGPVGQIHTLRVAIQMHSIAHQELILQQVKKHFHLSRLPKVIPAQQTTRQLPQPHLKVLQETSFQFKS